MIIFDSGSHTYKVGGLIKPSVTQVLDIMGMVSPFCKSETAAAIGTELHSIFEKLDKGEADYHGPILSDWRPVNNPYLLCIEMYERYKDDINPTFTDIECLLYDEVLDVCGTVDRAGTGPDFIMDIKTGSSVPESARLQTAAYAMMRFPLTYTETKRYCLHVNPKLKNYKIKTYEDPYDFVEWENLCKSFWKRMRS